MDSACCIYVYLFIQIPRYVCVTKIIRKIQAISLRVEYIGDGQGRVAGRDWKEKKGGGSDTILFLLKH